MLNLKSEKSLKTFFLSYTVLFLLNLFVTAFSYSGVAEYSYIDILYRSVSLITLTGQSPDNFYHTYSSFGIWAYPVLMQINALFFWIWVGLISIRFLNGEKLISLSWKKIVGFILLFEAIIFLVFYYTVSGGFEFTSLGQRIHFCLTYSIGSLSNFRIGFLQSGSVNYNPDDLLLFNLTMFGSAVLGSLGYLTIMDLVHPKNLRKRLENAEIDWKLYTKHAFYGTFILLGTSSILFIIIETNGIFQGLVTLEKIFQSSFLSVSSRFGEVGMNRLVDLNSFSVFIFLALVFVGGASGSITGGLKISLFYFLFKGPFLKSLVKILLIYLLFQFLSAMVLNMLLPYYSFKQSIILQFCLFFNTGLGGISPEPDLLKIYSSLLMLLGRIAIFLLPWYILSKINHLKIQKDYLI